MTPEAEVLSETHEEPGSWPKDVTYGSPGGFCAGVDGSVKAYRNFAKQYPNEQLYSVGVPAHNRHVVQEFEGRYKFVSSIDEVPSGVGAKVADGPHGDTDEDVEYARTNGMTLLRTECPLVTKVKNEVAINTEDGLVTLYYGQIDEEGEFHTETRAALSSGDAILVTSLEEALSDEIAEMIPDHSKVAFASQTTHNADHAREMREELQNKYPGLRYSEKVEDTCFATKHRQDAAKAVRRKIMVVVGDEDTSSNTRSLAAVSTNDDEENKVITVNNGEELSPEDFYGYDSVGVVASASTPIEQIRSVIDFFTSRGSVEKTVEVADESRIHFKPPIILKPYEPEIIWASE